MRWISLACCFLYSPLALAVQGVAAASPTTEYSASLVHDGYRLRGLRATPPLKAFPVDSAAPANCGSVPAAPAASAGALEVVPLVKDRFFNKFFQGGGRLYRMVTQQQGEPRAIVIHSGTWALPRLVASLSGQPDVLKRQGSAYLLRVPLLLEPGASLLVRDGESLRLGRERGAFIISMGNLHLQKARLEAWDEVRGKPAEVAEDGGSFSPFVVGWSGSRTIISQSVVSGLGFAEHLAQGLTLATGPIGLSGYTLPAPAIVNIQDSRFEGMYSAVHASSIPDLRLCRNQFIDSRQYAIHLDEGSSGLIQRNKITASRGPYALYFNKGVEDVKVLGNDISENGRSAIAISDSRNISLKDNEIRQNFDAIYLQGADEVLLSGNRILDNQRHGLSLRNVGRIRLKGDQIGPNRGVGILAVPASPEKGQPAKLVSKVPPGHAASSRSQKTELKGPQPAPVADAPLQQASYRSTAAMAASGGEQGDKDAEDGARQTWRPSVHRIELLGVTLEGNHSSALVVEKPYSILLDNVTVMYPGVRRRPVFRGVLNYFESDILKRLERREILLIDPSKGTGKEGSRNAGK